ncbi:MAG: hypothetical protein II243_08185 [Lachnospiraceae bacterium]|nr:hypothetical protein [Lachnospiraceae bacterium]
MTDCSVYINSVNGYTDINDLPKEIKERVTVYTYLCGADVLITSECYKRVTRFPFESQINEHGYCDIEDSGFCYYTDKI